MITKLSQISFPKCWKKIQKMLWKCTNLISINGKISRKQQYELSSFQPTLMIWTEWSWLQSTKLQHVNNPHSVLSMWFFILFFLLKCQIHSYSIVPADFEWSPFMSPRVVMGHLWSDPTQTGLSTKGLGVSDIIFFPILDLWPCPYSSNNKVLEIGLIILYILWFNITLFLMYW